MKTVSINIENLCVPCSCHCRHCLLSSTGVATGIDYQRGQAFAGKFYDWVRSHRPELSGFYYIGYCNECDFLSEHVQFVKKYAPGYDFLQFNGLKLRDKQEIEVLLHNVMESGVRLIDLTFFGTEAYHDRFAGRKGDFAYLLDILRTANDVGLDVVASICLTMENADQMEALFGILDQYRLKSRTVFLPHDKGRGEKLSRQRMTKACFDGLPQVVKDNFMRQTHKTEAAWIADGDYPNLSKRSLTLALTRENIDRLEAMKPGDILRELEEMDETYYAQLPSVKSLAALVGDSENQQIYRFRDLYLQWQKRYFASHTLQGPDMSEETHSFSIRHT